MPLMTNQIVLTWLLYAVYLALCYLVTFLGADFFGTVACLALYKTCEISVIRNLS